jgi:uncharacterized membrane protein
MNHGKFAMIKACIISLTVLTLVSMEAKADIITFNFAGTVSNRFNNGSTIGLPSDRIFDASINVSDAVAGSFTLDTATLPSLTANGPISGTAALYLQNSPLELKVSINNTLVQAVGTFNGSVSNDYKNNPAIAPIDVFQVSDGVYDGSTNFSGSQILVGGQLENAQLLIQFNDFQATTFNSVSLPSTIDLSAMENAYGRVQGTRDGVTYFVEFRVASITAVPEPSSFIAVLVGLLGFKYRRLAARGSH